MFEALRTLPEDQIRRLIREAEQELGRRADARSAALHNRVKDADAGRGDLKEHELIYSAYHRCSCGAGLAYPEGIGPKRGAWDCAEILKGKANTKVLHTTKLPFSFFDVRSERDPKAKGRTTRPLSKI